MGLVKLTDEQLYAKDAQKGVEGHGASEGDRWINRRRTGEFNQSELKAIRSVDKYKLETGVRFVSVVEMAYIFRHAELW